MNSENMMPYCCKLLHTPLLLDPIIGMWLLLLYSSCADYVETLRGRAALSTRKTLDERNTLRSKRSFSNI